MEIKITIKMTGEMRLGVGDLFVTKKWPLNKELSLPVNQLSDAVHKVWVSNGIKNATVKVCVANRYGATVEIGRGENLQIVISIPRSVAISKMQFEVGDGFETIDVGCYKVKQPIATLLSKYGMESVAAPRYQMALSQGVHEGQVVEI